MASDCAGPPHHRLAPLSHFDSLSQVRGYRGIDGLRQVFMSIEAQSRPPVKLGVLISGEGSNLQAIIDAVGRGELLADIRLVISNKAGARGLERARLAGIAALLIEQKRFASREEFDLSLVAALNAHEVELVACAGFMRLLSPVMLRAFPNRIMNIHPALSPAFPGIDAQRAAREYGVRFSGCTVFFVTEGVDDGPIIVQAVVPVMPNDDEETLAARIRTAEHLIYPYAIRLFQEGRLHVDGRKVLVDGAGLADERLIFINPPLL
jgi:phosphoribosylglycinamide formyltransferase-1